jgi:mono/diheme cytochrome c family protein
MFRTNRVMALGAAIGLVAFVACSGGETGAQGEAGEAAAGQVSETAAEGQAQQGEVELPEGVTMEMVNQGRELYAGAGLCYVCHGAEGMGMPGLGAALTDSEWTHSDGSFEGIVTSVVDGVTSDASTTGTAMPAKGGSGITDDQARAVAAYVYMLRGGM